MAEAQLELVQLALGLARVIPDLTQGFLKSVGLVEEGLPFVFSFDNLLPSLLFRLGQGFGPFELVGKFTVETLPTSPFQKT